MICRQIKNLVKHNCLNHSIRLTSWYFVGQIAGPLMKVAAPKDVLTSLASMTSASAIDGAIQIKMSRQGVVRT